MDKHLTTVLVGLGVVGVAAVLKYQYDQKVKAANDPHGGSAPVNHEVNDRLASNIATRNGNNAAMYVDGRLVMPNARMLRGGGGGIPLYGKAAVNKNVARVAYQSSYSGQVMGTNF